MIRRLLGEILDTTVYRLKVTTCPFGCGETLIYTSNGVQCTDQDCGSRGGPVSRIPPRSPYQHGDRVQMHGYPGEEAGHRRTGFRGVVTGSLGSTILRGVTDQGDEWAEYWGGLYPDGTRASGGGAYCSCCPRRARRAVQLELFAVSA